MAFLVDIKPLFAYLSSCLLSLTENINSVWSTIFFGLKQVEEKQRIHKLWVRKTNNKDKWRLEFELRVAKFAYYAKLAIVMEIKQLRFGLLR